MDGAENTNREMNLTENVQHPTVSTSTDTTDFVMNGTNIQNDDDLLKESSKDICELYLSPIGSMTTTLTDSLKNQHTKYVYNGEMNIFQWFEGLLKMVEYIVGDPIYFGIAKLILETSNLTDFVKGRFDINRIKIQTDFGKVVDRRLLTRVQNATKNSLRRVLGKANFGIITEKFDLFNCNFSFVEDLRLELGVDPDEVSSNCDIVHRIYLIKKHGSTSTTGPVIPELAELEALNNGSFGMKLIEKNNYKLTPSSVQGQVQRTMRKQNEIIQRGMLKQGYLTKVRNLWYLFAEKTANQLMRIAIQEMTNSVRENRDVNTETLFAFIDALDAKGELKIYHKIFMWLYILRVL